MSKSYLPWTQDQPYLLPPSLRDWLPERHLAWFILEVVATLDLSPIAAAIEAKDSRGQRPYHPQMMVALLMYGYCTGVFSSRKLERATSACARRKCAFASEVERLRTAEGHGQ